MSCCLLLCSSFFAYDLKVELGVHVISLPSWSFGCLDLILSYIEAAFLIPFHPILNPCPLFSHFNCSMSSPGPPVCHWSLPTDNCCKREVSILASRSARKDRVTFLWLFHPMHHGNWPSPHTVCVRLGGVLSRRQWAYVTRATVRSINNPDCRHPQHIVKEYFSTVNSFIAWRWWRYLRRTARGWDRHAEADAWRTCRTR